MDKREYCRDHEVPAGVITKAASLSTGEVTEADLKAINKYALEPLSAEQVFVFRTVLCDNEIDRSYERFNLKALQDLQKLFLGKTVIKNHSWDANDQVARIYSTELVSNANKSTQSGEAYTQLVASCYMLRTASNEDLIAEIKGGIKKEGSVGCTVTGSICSVCGTDNVKSYCRHYPGKSYEKEGGATVCTFTLTGAKDAYEFSLVAVPAQKAAGVCKNYTGKTVYDEETPAVAEEKSQEEDLAKELALRARLGAARAKTNQ